MPPPGETSSMPEQQPLQILVLGELAVARAGAIVPLPPSKRTRALLAYLAVSARRHRRDRLCEVFWHLPDDPRAALRWSLSRLRPVVDAPERPRILADRETVGLDGGSIEIDLLAGRAALAAGLDNL